MPCHDLTGHRLFLVIGVGVKSNRDCNFLCYLHGIGRRIVRNWHGFALSPKIPICYNEYSKKYAIET